MRMLSRIVSCVLMACCMFANVSLGFQTPFMPRSLAKLKDAGWHARYDTSLQMGLRSFLKTKVLGRKEDMGEKVRAEKLPKKETKVTVASEEKAAATTINVTGPVTDAPVAKTKAKPVEKESRKEENLPPLRTESIKDRLNRVRSGKMTEDEKQAFLRTALSAKDTATSRKPLRQRLPDETVEGNRPASGNNATPFPTLLKNVASTWGKNDTRASEVPLRSWRDGAKMKDQQKKRDYFAMVTDPNRFHTYKSSKVTAPGNATEYDVVHDGVIRPQIDMEEEEEETTAVEQLGMEEQETIVVGDDDDESKEYEHMGQVAGDLGTRLETAAIALEEAAKAREQERLETEKRLEKQRLEQKQRLEELRIKQQLEMEKRELELKAKKREEEEVMAREIEKRRREEEARRRELMEAQDTYWAKKLQAEREARMRGMSQKQKEEFVKQEALETKKAMEVAQQESTTPIATNEFAPKFKKPDVEVRPKAVLGVQKKMLDPFQEEQARKRADMQRAKDEQIARLKALSSPLPSQSPRSPPTVPPPRMSDTAMRGASELSKLMNPPKPAPVPSIPVEKPMSEPTVAEMMKKPDYEPELKVTKEESGFFKKVLGVRKNDDARVAEKKKNVDTAIAEKQPVRQAQPPEKESGKRRVVRQKLPLGDEDDFDTFSRNGPNKYMSIADALKETGESGPSGSQEQRSKMWGVDMSRITKSLEDEKNK